MIASGSLGAWHEIETRLRPFVQRRVGSRADADDVLQDVLLRVQRGLGELRDEDRFGPWVYRLARNAIADHGRKHARRAAREASLDPGIAVPVVDDDPDLEADLGECVALFVARLPSPYREAITLTELEGLTQREAAGMLGISTSGLKSRVQRGRAKIREMFEACCEISQDCRGRVVECVPRNGTR